MFLNRHSPSWPEGRGRAKYYPASRYVLFCPSKPVGGLHDFIAQVSHLGKVRDRIGTDIVVRFDQLGILFPSMVYHPPVPYDNTTRPQAP